MNLGGGRSVYALFEVDREWNRLAAASVFEVRSTTWDLQLLLTSRCAFHTQRIPFFRCSERIFGFSIVQKYGACVKKVSFAGGNSEERRDYEALLLPLSSLPNVVHLTISRVAFEDLFGDKESNDVSEKHYSCRIVLRSTLQAIKHLSIENCPAADFPFLLGSAIKLRRLDLQLQEYVEDVDEARGEVAKLRTIENLSMEDIMRQPASATLPVWTFAPSLKALKIKLTSEPVLDSWTSVQQFGATPENFHLVVALGGPAEEDLKDVKAPEQGEAFPFLRQLILRGFHTSIAALLPFFAILSSNPSYSLELELQIVVPVQLRNTPEPPLPSLVHSALVTISSALRSLVVQIEEKDSKWSTISLRLARPESLITMARACRSAGVVFHRPLPYDLFLDPRRQRDDNRSRRKRTTRRCDTIDHLLTFGLHQSARARATRDVDAAETLMWALMGLKALEMREKD